MSGEQLLVLIVGPSQAVHQRLASALPSDRFELLVVESGHAFAEALAHSVPDIAVVDRVHERLDEARDEVRQLKQHWATLPIIAISEHPSTEDASLVELGVFYYLAGSIGQNLVDLVTAAARRLEGASRKVDL